LLSYASCEHSKELKEEEEEEEEEKKLQQK
jgi:hypothetical protein